MENRIITLSWENEGYKNFRSLCEQVGISPSLTINHESTLSVDEALMKAIELNILSKGYARLVNRKMN